MENIEVLQIRTKVIGAKDGRKMAYWINIPEILGWRGKKVIIQYLGWKYHRSTIIVENGEIKIVDDLRTWFEDVINHNSYTKAMHITFPQLVKSGMNIIVSLVE